METNRQPVPFPAQNPPDEAFMCLALDEARSALDEGEVPVGAVLVEGDTVLGRGRNAVEASKLPTAHAEIRALEAGARTHGDWRLAGTTLYVTLEPCPMCAGALLMARVKRVVFGTSDPRWGCVGSRVNLLDFPGFLQRLEVRGGVLQEECKALLDEFFKQLRRRDG